MQNEHVRASVQRDPITILKIVFQISNVFVYIFWFFFCILHNTIIVQSHGVYKLLVIATLMLRFSDLRFLLKDKLELDSSVEKSSFFYFSFLPLVAATHLSRLCVFQKVNF